MIFAKHLHVLTSLTALRKSLTALRKRLTAFNKLTPALLLPAALSTSLSTGLALTLTPTLLARSASAETMYVSWYGPGFDGGYTANGEVFSRYDHTAAHPSWAFNTLVRLTHLDTGTAITVRINDRSGGGLDISEQAARDLGTYEDGIATVDVEILEWGY